MLKHLLTASEIDFGDARLFFREQIEVFRHPFYPEVVLGWHGSKAELLALSDVTGDYSLHRPPITDEAAWQDTNENPSEAVEQVDASRSLFSS